MQSPTPPTKPTPPTPPTMNTSSAVPTTITHSPAAPIAEQSAVDPNSASQSAATIPPFASYNTSTNTSQETSGKALTPPTAQLPKTKSSSMGFSFFFVLILMISVIFVAVHWWKNYKPKEKVIIDYSAESSDDIVSLILSQSTFEAVPQAAPKTQPKKVSPKAEKTPKTKGNFEVRV